MEGVIMNKNFSGILAGVAMCVFCLPAAYSAYQVGDAVVDFTLPDGHGVPHSLYDYRGQIILLNFWTSG